MKEEIFVGLYRRDMYAKVCLAKGAKQAGSGPDINSATQVWRKQIYTRL